MGFRIGRLLGEVAEEMEEADLIWVYGTGDEGVMAFTDFGIETLIGLIKSTKKTLSYSNDRPTPDNPAAHVGCSENVEQLIPKLFIHTQRHVERENDLLCRLSVSAGRG